MLDARRAVVLILCVSLLAACQGGPASDAPPGAPPPGATPTGDGPGGAPGGGDPAPGGGAGQEPGPGPDGAPAAGGGDAPDDLAGLGSLCRDYLRARRVVIEVDWQAGAQPSKQAVDHLAATLGEVAGAGVTVTGGEIPGTAEVSSAEDLRALAAAHRASYSTADELALYVLSVRGRFQEEGALGVAHRASEVAIFPDRIGGLSALLGGRAAVERAVLVHEAGHVLCLVNIGYQSELAREDAEHPKHSSDRASVMHWAIDTSAVGQLFNGPPPDRFTDQDLADLEGLRTGRY